MTSTKGWTLEGILDQGANFHCVERVSATAPDLHEKIKKYEANGVPLVIEGFHKHPKWPQPMFTVDQFVKSYGENDIKVRNIHDRTDSLLPLRDFIAKCRVLTPHRTKTETERLYGKDIECPKTWSEWLQNGDVIPKALISKGPEDVFRHLPNTVENAVETLMCYIGIGDTFTPCHKDSCASSGQNLMCYTERGGSSFWFMTASPSAQKAADYFQTLGHELDHECYFVKTDELSRAPFKVYVLEQKLGDMVLVPPRSCHQVINHGGVTFKTSWSRMTTRGLKSAFFHELPIYRRVCRPEIYQVKSTTYHSLLALTTELEGCLSYSVDSNGHILDELKELLLLFEAILAEEYDEEIAKQTPSNDGYRLTCDFCLAEIFQSYFQCNECNDYSDDPLHLCLGCYTEGRRCQCSVAMKPMQSRDFQILRQASSNALRVIQTYEERFNRKAANFSSELTTIRNEIPQLFRAGCTLYKLLQIPISTREKNCDVRRNKARSTHSTDVSNLIFCQKCPFATCYEHLLSDYKMHASEALLSTPGTSKGSYHAKHPKAKSRFVKDLKSASLDKARMKGDRPHGSQLYTVLAQNALKYTFCNPANHLLQPGWYDNVRPSKPPTMTIPGRVSRHQWIENSSTHASTVSLSPSEPQSPPNSCADQAFPSSQSSILVRSIKRKFDVFVEVPSAPYDISRFKRHHLENAKRPNPTHSTDSADKSTAVTEAETKQSCTNTPRVSSPNKPRSVNAHAATRHQVRSSKLRNTDTPPAKGPIVRSSSKGKSASPSQAVDTGSPRFEPPKIPYPKFKKNLPTVPPTNRDSHVEDDNPHTCSDSTSRSHGRSSSTESSEPIHSTDESGNDHTHQVPSMAIPTQETHIHPPSQSIKPESVSSLAAVVHTLAPIIARAIGLETPPAMAPVPDQYYYQQYLASSHPHRQDTIYQQQFQQPFTYTHPHGQEPLYQQQYLSEASFHPAHPYYNDAPRWFTPSHYYYAGPPSHIPGPLYGREIQATSSQLPQSPHKPTRRDKWPRLERQRWERDPSLPPSSQNFPGRTISHPAHSGNYTRKDAYPRNGRKSFPHNRYSPKQRRPQSTPYGNGEHRIIHRSTSAHIPRPPMRLERRSFPDVKYKQGRARQGTEQQREQTDHTLNPAGAYNERYEWARQRIDNQPELPIPVDSSLDSDIITPSQESENRRDIVDAAKEPDYTSEDNWEEGYEKLDEDDIEVSSHPRFRMSSEDLPQDDTPQTHRNDHDQDHLSSNPFNHVNPWN